MQSIDLSKSGLHYDPLTGVFTRNGKEAGSVYKIGYRVISVNNKRYYAHRLAWLFVFGEFPKSLIDHINQNKLDNRIGNLREASYSLNSSNTPVRSHSKVGYKHIGYDRRDGAYQVRIVRDGKEYYFGRSKSLEEALLIREEAYATIGGC